MTIILCFIALVCLVVLKHLGRDLNNTFWDMADSFTCSHGCSHRRDNPHY